MPRASKGPRLWRRPERRRGRKVIASSVWIIRDGNKHIATGCLASQAEKRPPAEAERALANYISSKYSPPRKARDVDTIDIADVLAIYLSDKEKMEKSSPRLERSIGRLNDFFGGKMLGDMSTDLCAEYAKKRGNKGGARRDLEDLRAAIGHHASENLHHAVIKVALPDKGLPRDRWLTRSEAAQLIWMCWKYREVQTAHRGVNKGHLIATDKRPLRHLARFLLIGVYTGTRHSAILSASPYDEPGHSYVDLDRGVYYRLARGRAATNKRQTPIPVPSRLLAHMRRWKEKKIIATHFVEWAGEPVKSVKTAFANAVELTKLKGKISPHTLRHTAATWMMQRGVDPWQAAGYLAMSVKVLLDTYGHHHPDYMKDAADGITRKDRKPNVALVEKVVDLNKAREKLKKTA